MEITADIIDCARTCAETYARKNLSHLRVEDVLQEFCIRFIKLEHLQINYRGYVYIMIRNIYSSLFRIENSQQRCYEKQTKYFDENYIDESFDLDMVLFAKTHRAVRVLRQTSMHDAFILYVNGVSYERIAQKLEIPVGTAKSRIFNARKLLKTVMQNKEIIQMQDPISVPTSTLNSLIKMRYKPIGEARLQGFELMQIYKMYGTQNLYRLIFKYDERFYECRYVHHKDTDERNVVGSEFMTSCTPCTLYQTGKGADARYEFIAC